MDVVTAFVKFISDYFDLLLSKILWEIDSIYIDVSAKSD